MVRSSQDRLRKFNRKREHFPAVYTSMITDPELPVDRIGKRAEIDASIEAILDRYKIFGTDRIKYYNFARKALKRQGRWDEEKLEALKNYYITVEGAKEEVLDDLIRSLHLLSPTI